MRLGIPIEAPNGMDSEVNDHFGMSEYFALIEMDGDRIAKLDIVENDPSSKDRKTAAAFLADKGVDIVLAGGIGPHMIKEILDGGLRLFRGAVGSVEQAFEDYKAGMLTEVRTVGDME
jgi:predicted Fe-Mo cluster-binding NifX family protein